MTTATRTRVGMAALCERELARVLKIWTQTIAFPTFTALLYLTVFGVSLGERIGLVGGVPYLTFIVPGVVLMQCATQSYANTSASVFQARSDGYIDDILSAPMHAWQVSVALLLGGVLRGLVVASLVLAIGAAVTDLPIAHPFQAAGLLLCVSVLWASVGVVAGTWAQTFDQHMLVGNLFILPLAFVGGVFYSVDMLPDRLQPFARLDPLFYQVQGMRHALLGTSDTSFALAAGLTVGLAAICFAVQVRLFVSGWRLKD